MNIHETPAYRPTALNVVKLLSAVGVLSASSCSLPPRESWNRVQQEGLIPVMLAGRGGTAEKSESPDERTETKDQPIEQVAASETDDSEEKGRDATTTRGSFARSGRYPIADPVPGAAGYVYSPFEAGEKAVDVSSLGQGVKARCPYSGKIFIVPDFSKPIEKEPAVVAKSSGSSSSEMKELRRIASSIEQTESSTGSERTVRSKPTPKPRTILPEPVLPPSPQETSSEFAEQSDSPGQNILEGTRVAGRPGYVRSPYAGSNQLVDVTGLSPGQEVRCPYSGKLFKVPAMGEMSDVSPIEPKTDSTPAPEADLPTDEDVADDVPVASNDEPEPILEPRFEEEEDQVTPKIVDSAEQTPVELPTDATGLARPETPKPSAPASKTPSLPVAKRIAGKKGLVRSPFGSEGQLVDVTGKSPGSQVLCPFTGKPFIVPK